MITIYHPNEENFATLGMGALRPIDVTITWEKGGRYDLTLKQPIQDDGKWMMIGDECIIKAPSPVRESPYVEQLAENAGSQTVTREIYKVKTPSGGRLRLRKSPSTNAKILSSHKPGTEVVKTETNGDWTKVIVIDGGAIGWMWSEYLSYARTEAETVPTGDKPGVIVKRRQAGDQLYRISDYETDSTNGIIIVNAEHISYDLGRVKVIGECNVKDMSVMEVLNKVQTMASREHDFEIHCLVDGKVTGDYTHKSLLECIRDPKIGFAAQLNARVVCDNFDIWILPNETRDMGVVLKYRKNLLGVKMKVDTSNRVTRIYPVGEKAEGELLYIDGGKYVESKNAANVIGRDKVVKYDVRVGKEEGEYATEEEAKEELERRAREEIQAGADGKLISLDVNFLDIGETEEYAQYKNLMVVHPYDTVTIIRGDFGIREKAELSKCVLDGLTKKYKSTTFGALQAETVTVHSFDIAQGAVGGMQIAQGAVGTGAIRKLAIQYAQIAQATVERLNAAAIDAVSGRFDEIIAGSLTAEKLYAAVAEIILLRFGEITGERIKTDELYAELADIILLRAKEIVADNIDVDELAAEYARITSMLVDRIDAGNIQTDVLGASLANFVSMYAGTGEFDFATIQNLVAKAMSLTQGAMDTVYINNLAVTSANMLSATLGKLVIKGDDGNYYRVFVGSDGRISTEKVDDVTAEVQGGKQIVETNMNVGNLNATTIQGSSAVINSILTTALTADKITAADAMIASATVPALYTTTIEAIGNSLQLLVRDSSRIFRSETPPSGAELGDLWVQPSTGFTYQFAGENVPDLYLNDPDLYYAHADDEGGYSLMMDAEGDLYADGEAAYTLGVSMDGHLTAWLRVKDGELDKAAKEALEKSNENAALIVEQSADIKIAKDKIDSRVEVSVFNEVTGELETSVSSVNQRADSLEISMEKKVDGETLRTYIRYEDGVVEIGRSDSRYTTHTSDSGFVVKQDGVEMTSMVKNTVSAPVMEARRQFQIGRFSIRTGNDGGLLFL